jgi:hypothetical protein
MKQIDLSEAVRLLESCAAVLCEDAELCFPELIQLGKRADGIFLFVTTEHEHFEFTEKDNQKVIVAGSSMWLTDITGEEVQLSLLDFMKLE